MANLSHLKKSFVCNRKSIVICVNTSDHANTASFVDGHIDVASLAVYKVTVLVSFGVILR